MQNDILFDNIYIGHSIEDAEKFRAETWDIKHPIELAEEEATRPKEEEKKKEGALSFKESPVEYTREKIDLFISIARQDPIQAAKVVPEVAGGLGALLLTLILIVVGAIGLSSPAPAPAAKKQQAGKGKESGAIKEKEKAAEAVSTAADNVKGGAKKRSGKASE